MNIFKGKKPKVEEVPGKLPESLDITKTTAQKVKEWLGTLGAPYGGELTAWLTPTQESYMQRILRSSEQSPTLSDIYAPARRELMDIISGRYFVEPSPMYRYLQRQIWEEELPRGQAELRRALSLANAFSSSYRGEQERELIENALDTLARLRAEELMRERERQALAIQPALQLAQYETYEPIQRLTSALQLADIERQLQQQELSARYQDWLRQQQELYGLLPAYIQMGTTPGLGLPTYQYVPGKPSIFSQYVAPAILGGLTGGLGGLFGGGLAGALGGAVLGGLSQGQALPLLTLGSYLGNWNLGNIPAGATSYGGGSWGRAIPIPNASAGWRVGDIVDLSSLGF